MSTLQIRENCPSCRQEISASYEEERSQGVQCPRCDAVHLPIIADAHRQQLREDVQSFRRRKRGGVIISLMLCVLPFVFMMVTSYALGITTYESIPFVIFILGTPIGLMSLLISLWLWMPLRTRRLLKRLDSTDVLFPIVYDAANSRRHGEYIYQIKIGRHQAKLTSHAYPKLEQGMLSIHTKDDAGQLTEIS